MRKTPFFLLCTLLLCISVLYIFLNVTRRGLTESNPSTIYLELWHVDTFEGGTGSRSSFLQSLSREYAKKSEIKIIVKVQTALSCEQNFKKGVYPDIISYGNGIDLPYQNLWGLGTSSSENTIGGQYSKVWCCGGYLLIERQDVECDGVIISTQEGCIPQLAYHLSRVEYPIFEEVDSKNAVYSFYQHKDKALLCTQRDLYRLKDKGLNLQIQTLNGYNDLFQYVSIITCEEQKVAYAQAFINYLTGFEVLDKLNKIGMINCNFKIKNTFENPLDVFDGIQWEYVTEDLLSKERLKNLQEMAKNYPQNSESIKNTLKRLK